ncbi:MAG: LacI family DNA-binding transcriptional regulator [Bacilli bacterium]|nr:LacI family DNA-binding transcriptional regulator [Bacilli bacterium]
MTKVEKKRPTIFDVAKEANVSIATVSRVINGIQNVSGDTKELVLKAIDKLGFVSSNLARGLAKSQTLTVAVVIPSPNYNYISSILSGMFDVCKIYGYLVNVFTFEDVDDAARVVDQVISSRVEGIVIFNSQLNQNDLQKLTNISLPMVVIGNNALSNKNGLVCIDYSLELKEVIYKKIINQGIKEVVFLRDPDDNKDWHMVHNFDSAIEEGIKKSEQSVTYSHHYIKDSYMPIYEYYSEKFKQYPPHGELYITPRDSVSIAISNAASDLGYRAGKDFEIIGIIGTKTSKTARPTISSFDVDLYEVGSITMRMLTKILDNSLKNKEFHFQTKYIARESAR